MPRLAACSCRLPVLRPAAPRCRAGALAAALMLAAAWGGPAGAAELPAGSGLFGGLLPIPAADLAGLASGGPLVLSAVETAGGGIAANSVALGPDGAVSIQSSASAAASVTGAPVVLSSGGQLQTGSIDGNFEMANSGGIATLQVSSGLNSVQQSAVSSAFVVSGLPQLQ